MSNSARLASLVLLAASLAGCPTSARRTDAGRPAADTGTVDASTPHDGGGDAASPVDAAMGMDAAMPIDAATPVDAASPVDVGTDAFVAMIDAGRDGGLDAGRDAGTDAGRDGGLDAGRDAGTDAGTTGTDAGSTGACTLTHLVISEIRSRGAAGANDDFVEIFNPTGSDVVLDSSWTLTARSSTAGTYGGRWTGSGATIPAHGRYLIGGTAYAGTPAADAMMSSGITDATSLLLSQAGTVVDAVCYAFDAAGATALAGTGYTCEGAAVSTNPHDNSTATNTDASIERLPGGAGGNCTDTGNNAADFTVAMPSTPRT